MYSEKKNSTLKNVRCICYPVTKIIQIAIVNELNSYQCFKRIIYLIFRGILILEYLEYVPKKFSKLVDS